MMRQAGLSIVCRWFLVQKTKRCPKCSGAEWMHEKKKLANSDRDRIEIESESAEKYNNFAFSPFWGAGGECSIEIHIKLDADHRTFSLLEWICVLYTVFTHTCVFVLFLLSKSCDFIFMTALSLSTGKFLGSVCKLYLSDNFEEELFGNYYVGLCPDCWLILSTWPRLNVPIQTCLRWLINVELLIIPWGGL